MRTLGLRAPAAPAPAEAATSPVRARSPLHGLPKHLLDDIEEDDVIEYLAVALTWLVVSTAFSVFVGKCIASGLAGGGTRAGVARPGQEVDVPPQRASFADDRVGAPLPGALPS